MSADLEAAEGGAAEGEEAEAEAAEGGRAAGSSLAGASTAETRAEEIPPSPSATVEGGIAQLTTATGREEEEAAASQGDSQGEDAFTCSSSVLLHPAFIHRDLSLTVFARQVLGLEPRPQPSPRQISHLSPIYLPMGHRSPDIRRRLSPLAARRWARTCSCSSAHRARSCAASPSSVRPSTSSRPPLLLTASAAAHGPPLTASAHRHRSAPQAKHLTSARPSPASPCSAPSSSFAAA